MDKRHYGIFFKGKYIAETYAVSPRKALCNYFWRVKQKGSKYTLTEYNPADYEAVEIF